MLSRVRNSPEGHRQAQRRRHRWAQSADGHHLRGLQHTPLPKWTSGSTKGVCVQRLLLHMVMLLQSRCKALKEHMMPSCIS